MIDFLELMDQVNVNMEKLKTVRRESLPYELARGRRRSANQNSDPSKSRYSLGTIYECYNTRLTRAYRSINKNQLKDLRQSLSIQEEIDAGEPPPVDESLFFENLLESKNTDLNRLKTTLWSLLSAQEMKLMLELEKGNLSNFTTCDSTLKNTAYLWACFRNLTQLLPKLESLGADFRYTEPRTGMNAVLVSSLAESRSCLEYLILTKEMSPNVSCKSGNFTPLHFAALANSKPIAELILANGAHLTFPHDFEPVLFSAIRAGSSEVFQLLLDKGVDVTETNQVGESCLHIACSVQSISMVESLLQVPGIDLNCTNNFERTPLHYSVMSAQGSSSLELVDLLIKNGALINIADQVGYTPLHIAALNELSECVESLIWAGADVSATTTTGHTALSIILKKIPETLQVFRDRLDSCIVLQRPATHNKEFEMRLHFDVLFPSNHPCETSFINTFVEEHRKDLLSHPLVMAFLYLKWEKIKNFYLARIFIYTLTVIFITTYVLSALAYKCYNRNDPDQKTCSGKRFSGLIFQKTAIEIQWYLALFLICILIPQKVLAFLVHRSEQYFRNIENILDIIVFLSVFATSFVYTGRTYDWQNYVGAFGVLCGWTNLMLMVGQLPSFGTYVAMFTHIQFEFAKLLLAYSGLLIGFALSFCVIFVSEPSFGNPFTGLIKVLAMMAGDVDFEGLINQDILDGSYIIYHPLSVCSQILITLFIIFVTVILMNLLVGIAVNDIQSLRNHAGLTKLVRQAKMILFTEMVLCNKKLPKLFRRWASRYNVNIGNRKLILVVKPLNSLEKRLPRDILKVAYEIAQKNPPLGESLDGVATKDQVDDLSLSQKVLDGLVTRMKEQEIDIKVLHEQLVNANKLLESIYNKVLV